MSNPIKVAYLFGAGATHAELADVAQSSGVNPNDFMWLEKNGLLLKHVSKRATNCINREVKDKKYLKSIKSISSAEGFSNIELFISIIENNHVKNYEKISERLKFHIKKDILNRLPDRQLKKFYLHKALFEYHEMVQYKEKLTGLISLNYDSVLDDAYKHMIGTPNYCISSEMVENDKIPLLKLHGSFEWDSIEINGRIKSIPIIPLGISKNYLTLPYNLIWNRTIKVLMECDILRIVGCSMSQNDISLIDLLFKAYEARVGSFKLQVINFNSTGKTIKTNYGFFPNIQTAFTIDGGILSGYKISNSGDGGNPFRAWLNEKSTIMIKDEKKIDDTQYLKKCKRVY